MIEHLDQLRRAIHDFSLDIYHQIASTPSNGNIFLSPLSISSALLLTYVGARSETRAEIESTLRIQKYFSGNDEAVLKAYEEILDIFVPRKDQDGNKTFELALANQAYINHGFQVNPEYSNAIKKYLHSEMLEVPFKEDSESARLEINAWVEKQTNSKIKDLVAQGVIDDETVMILVNAIYFRANWANLFDDKMTSDQDFHNLNGEVSRIKLMFINGEEYQYLENDDGKFGIPPFQMIEIPYKANEVSLMVLLPRDKNGLPEFEKKLTGDILEKINEASSRQEVNLWLPRFKLEETYYLIELLKDLGIKHLFQDDADLSGIADRLVVSEAIHKAFVEVNEKGTEAAAATMMTLVDYSLPPPVPEFRADHPFVFAIRHQSTGLILFLGRLVKLADPECTIKAKIGKQRRGRLDFLTKFKKLFR